MARTGNPNSATSQFFINVKDNDMLNAPNPDGYGYTVFGKVVAGHGRGRQDPRRARPATRAACRTCRVEPVIIQSATVVAK